MKTCPFVEIITFAIIDTSLNPKKKNSDKKEQLDDIIYWQCHLLNLALSRRRRL